MVLLTLLKLRLRERVKRVKLDRFDEARGIRILLLNTPGYSVYLVITNALDLKVI
jgi:hypothetical protein